MIELDVFLSPREAAESAGFPAEGGGFDAILAVDLLRATTLETTFFELGGRVLLPVEEVEEARELRRALGAGWLLLGERGALPPEGFDFGNSPLELIASAGRIRSAEGGIHTTTNGTRAILAALGLARTVLAACARNARAAARAALAEGRRIGILCAGLEGRAAADDAACAGLLAERIREEGRRIGASVRLSDGAKMARAWLAASGGDLSRSAAEAAHAGRLRRLGLEEDLAYCCETDRSETVPRCVRSGGRPVLRAL